MFNGSENYKDDWFKVMEAGRRHQAQRHHLVRPHQLLSERADLGAGLALWMESDRMGHLLGAIDQKVLDEQRGVVQNEKRQGQNRRTARSSEVITQSTIRPGHPYSWETIGSMEDLNAASLEDVKEWFRTYYGAANAVLVIAGDMTAAEAQAEGREIFRRHSAGPGRSSASRNGSRR